MNTDLARNARIFAVERHGEQKYGDRPYEEHLCAVVVMLCTYGFDGRYPELCAAGWCHDVVEDTATTIAEVRERFGVEVARLVWAVTNEPGKNRKERALATYPKIRAAGSHAVTLKLCDRIANVEASRRSEDSKLSMYRKEHTAFREALFSEEDGETVLALWDRLDKLLGFTG
jgi:(p)ppGpp synthase/HD superfamily hydrolase